MAATEQKASRPKPTHPTFLQMAKEALAELGEKSGSSVQKIQGYIVEKYNLDADSVRTHLKPALAKGLESEALVRPKNSDAKGFTGKFKLNKVKEAEEAKKQKEKEKAKQAKEKAAAAKTDKKAPKAKSTKTATKSPKKVAKSPKSKIKPAKKTAAKPKAKASTSKAKTIEKPKTAKDKLKTPKKVAKTPKATPKAKK